MNTDEKLDKIQRKANKLAKKILLEIAGLKHTSYRFHMVILALSQVLESLQPKFTLQCQMIYAVYLAGIRKILERETEEADKVYNKKPEAPTSEPEYTEEPPLSSSQEPASPSHPEIPEGYRLVPYAEKQLILQIQGILKSDKYIPRSWKFCNINDKDNQTWTPTTGDCTQGFLERTPYIKPIKPLDEYQQRVIQEQLDLIERYKKLDSFGRTKAYENLSTVEQGLLNRQHKAMEDYIRVLQERITMFGAL